MSDGQLVSIFLPDKLVGVILLVTQLEKMLPELAAILRKHNITKSMVYDHFAKRPQDGIKHSAISEQLKQ